VQTLLELLHERRTLTEWEVRYYVAQLTAGIKYCHERNILHRDLKLGNIFLGDGLRAKIADFGYAKRLSSNADGSIKRRLYVLPRVTVVLVR
jgi:polo-like kinase 1